MSAKSGPEHRVTVTGRLVETPRLLLRPWESRDVDAALEIYGDPHVSQWLTPAMDRITDAAAMAETLSRWIEEDARTTVPMGRWAVEVRSTGELVGGAAVLPLPSYNVDLEVAWQLAPRAWGKGYAAEAGHAATHYAFCGGADELFAVVRPRNERGAATAKRVGMEWVGETDKYYGLRLQVYRVRKSDLDPSDPAHPEARP
ncbi:GNAT family N-acetyltransferase [Streptomyces sp. NBC_01497]|uniref:GNAT family N-acetyltransferase n=1 Tax=Streptomyces sp. NBC_01497 TaxID=2903885 RepID=UPI002E30F14C|nr:GNAT family N-acetyltransferase [Streptomyces sp. NBC_01497]